MAKQQGCFAAQQSCAAKSFFAFRHHIIIIDELELKPGKKAYAVIKATEVMVGRGEHFPLSARNQFPGKILRIDRGAVNSIVRMSVLGGNTLSATIANAAVDELELAEGEDALAVIKSLSVMVGVD